MSVRESVSETSRSASDESTAVARRYNRLASVYDIYDAPMDWMGGKKRRKRLLEQASGKVLEVGIGTGRNLPYYPSDVELTGIDISPRMLEKAAARAAEQPRKHKLEIADVENLSYADNSFDTVTATCVFCSVADPVRGLKEIRRVVKPDGKVLLLEHVRPRNRFLGWLFDLLSPIIRRLLGPSINRKTEQNVKQAGLKIEKVMREGVWREMTAVPDK